MNNIKLHGICVHCLCSTFIKLIHNILFFPGSSVDLAPTLMTIYDSYSASINSSPPDASAALSADQSCAKQLQHHLAKSCSDIGDIHYENVQTVHCTTKCAMENVTQPRMEAPRVSSELNGDVPSALVNLVLPNDVKKRPLSVSSTSSSNSSTSSLPRHQRKKVATTSCLATATTTCVTTTRSGQSTLYGATVPMDTSAGLIATPPGDSKDVLPRTSLSNLCDIVNKDVHKVKFTSESGRNVYIDRVVTEILDSERSYVRDLNDIIQVCGSYWFCLILSGFLLALLQFLKLSNGYFYCICIVLH